ncbi:primary-amine oxidase [Paramicrobacterium agarici]|uniref:Amine oxidase n=1 Tax=Paramicrobacterium agarici TaxID=630514 RepID=A0A2A9DSY1_9MICO|nr:primary-amine oxidase [Microbacterium agarici]PFG29798.1 primary-amine oxidase [Microbacterium agarici]
MPDATHTHGKRVTRVTTPAHPLDPLTAAELDAGRAVLEREGLLGDSIRFPSVLPVEPAKSDVLAWRPGRAFDRSILYTLLDTATGRSREVIVSVTEDAVTSDTSLATTEAPYGQPPYLFEEYERVDAIVKQNPEWQQALRRRGVTDTDAAFCAPLAPGYFGFEDEVGRRIIRSLTFLRSDESDSPWSHPVEGLVVTIDLTSGEVVRVHDEGDVPIPEVDGNYDAARVGAARTSLKPIEITQPEGPSFSVDGAHVRWENWSFRVGFNAREGLVLNQVAFRDGDEDRSVLYRASVPEMVVPYGDTSPNRFWISYFDAGEYLLGKNGNPLSLGCDCLGVIHYFDGVIADDAGRAQTIPQVICMHEEDYGVLWKHTDLDGHPEVRRSRRLVVSYFSTVGNYDYGFFWYFYLDGTIQVEAKATGIVFNGAGIPGEQNPHALEIAPGLFAPVHQHLFCARLDVAIDGEANAIEEVDAVGMPTGDANPYGNAFTFTRTPLRSEKEAARLANPAAARSWHVHSTERTNRMGQPTAYHLVPQGLPTLLAQPDATVSSRAAFATKHLWATAYEDGQLWPAGQYPNQHAGDAGLPTYTADDRSLDGTDIVLWHTFGPTHLPRPEDFPIMPVDYSGFLFKPFGFFDENPALDLPDTAASSCGGGTCGCGDHGTSSCSCAH